MEKTEFETIADILHNHGLVGLRDYYKEKSRLLHRRYILAIVILITVFVCYVIAS